ncbi:MAG: hypothetical protein CL840_08940 [Crocinitomicaceae bacterium]|nr:hypothetical protein [Crocinitomicaceae bacterium]|tara:strand:- start:31360 stop:31596 length:237 start_codon:yes stop_codon:yes gene_type:complete
MQDDFMDRFSILIVSKQGINRLYCPFKVVVIRSNPLTIIGEYYLVDEISYGYYPIIYFKVKKENIPSIYFKIIFEEEV